MITGTDPASQARCLILIDLQNAARALHGAAHRLGYLGGDQFMEPELLNHGIDRAGE